MYRRSFSLGDRVSFSIANELFPHAHNIPKIFTPVVSGRANLLESLAELFVAQQAKQGVAYTEVRYSPHILAGAPEGLSAAAVVDAVTAGLRKGCDKHGIWVNQILCCMSLEYDWSPEVADIAIARHRDSPCAVVGIDIAAGEQHFEEAIKKKAPNMHGEAIARARTAGLGVTIHAGETGGVEHIRQALAEPLCATVRISPRSCTISPALVATLTLSVYCQLTDD